MKLTTTTQISVDGVMHGPGGQDEGERGVFERGGYQATGRPQYANSPAAPG